MGFRTRLGPVLESELGNTWPVVKIFRDWEFAVRLDWPRVRRVVEIGGHVGAFALWAAAHAPRARIVTFEPEPRNFRDLERNVERNGLADRITVINAAVGAADGKRTLTVPIQRNRASVTMPVHAAATTATEVECIGLERYLERACPGQIDVLKLDCEGAEWAIVPSLADTTLSRIEHVFVGCHAQDEREVDAMRELLAGHGFRSRVLSTGSDPDYRLLVTLWGERA